MGQGVFILIALNSFFLIFQKHASRPIDTGGLSDSKFFVFFLAASKGSTF
jgi:hypothetical protein